VIFLFLIPYSLFLVFCFLFFVFCFLFSIPLKTKKGPGLPGPFFKYHLLVYNKLLFGPGLKTNVIKPEIKAIVTH
jgi:hypothetical protein